MGAIMEKLTYTQAIALLGKELPQDTALKVFRTLMNWIEEQEEDPCIPIAVFRTKSGNGIVMTSRTEEKEHWDGALEPVVCNAMYLLGDQTSTISVQIIDPTEH